MSSKRLIYLDHSATTPVRPEVKEAMMPYFDIEFGNASSLYELGQRAHITKENARKQVAQALSASPEEIIFTSGGTESNNFALRGIIKASKDKKHIITSAIEHPAVLKTCRDLEKQGATLTELPVDKYGKISLTDLENAITGNTLLISIMYANNEIGTIEPIDDIAKVIEKAEKKYKHKIYFHTDAIQAIGKVHIDVSKTKIDLLSISSHKIYGPKGIGVLYIKKGTKIASIMTGGGHEFGLRAGTENIPAIVGLGKAIELAVKEIDTVMPKIQKLRDYLIKNILKIEHTQLNGHPTDRLPTNLNININYIEGEGLLLFLDDEGICASTGSACAAQSLAPSHVILAIGVPHEIAHGSLRLTLGYENTKEEIEHVLKVLPAIVQRLRSMSPLYKDEK